MLNLYSSDYRGTCGSVCLNHLTFLRISATYFENTHSPLWEEVTDTDKCSNN